MVGIAAWSVTHFNPAYGQGDGGTSGDSASSTTVDTTWGSVTVDGSDEITQGFTKTSGNPSDSEGDAGTRSSSTTPIPVSAIRRFGGIIKVSWQLDDTISNPETYRFRIERRYILASEEERGWRLMSESYDGTSYRDYDVGTFALYEFRVTPIAPDGTVLDPSHPVQHEAGRRAPVLGRGTETGVEINVAVAADIPIEDQRVTVTRYDHIEMNTGLGHSVVTDHSFPAGQPHVVVPDAGVTSGTIYYYTVDYNIEDPNTGAIIPTGVNPSPVAVMAGVVSQTVPSVPSVGPGTVAGTVRLSWTVADDNLQADVYEINRRAVKPFNDDDPTPIGTTPHKTFTYSPDDMSRNYEYMVRPITLQRTVGTAGAPDVYPSLQMPVCDTYQSGIGPIGDILAVQDMIGDPADHSYEPRVVDIQVLHSTGAQCQNLDPHDFYLKRVLYYAHRIDVEQCPDASTSCTVSGTMTPPTEPLYNVHSENWGFDRYTWIALFDNPLPAGEYEIGYEVCVVGFDDKCSNLVTTGRIFLGVAETPFTGASGEYSPVRDYPAGVLVNGVLSSGVH